MEELAQDWDEVGGKMGISSIWFDRRTSLFLYAI